MGEKSDRMWCTGEANGKPLQYSCLENPMNSMKRQKDMTLEDEPTRSESVQYDTEEEQRSSSKKNKKIRGWAKVETTLNGGCVW